MTEPTGLEIALVGMAGRFPGSSDVDEFWQAVRTGKSAVRQFTDDEVDGAGVSEQQRRAPGYVTAGAVLEGVEHFDAKFFGYSPRDAALLDPQQRLFLETSWHALEHAGFAGRRKDDEVVGVYASATMSSYLLRHLIGNPNVPGGLSPLELVLGNDKDTLASRVAYHLDLTGPAISVQTACSSSLVAIHLACQALLSRDCDIALAGGVSVRLPQHEGYQHHEGSILAPDGRCLPFDADAAGVVGGNGVAVVVLRPLADALRDGDTIHAVIRGSAVNNDGAGKVGFTAPSVLGQAAAIRAAHEVSDVDPRDIGYLEAHGTGTALGDPVEVAALLKGFTDLPDSCALGSVKALVGHLDAAAGVTGFVKAALAVKHGEVPPSPYFRSPNPELGLADSPFFVNPEPVPWPSPRFAGVSAFGMGGTNAHAVLEEPPAVPGTPSTRSAQLIVLSAATAAALRTSRERFAEAVGTADLADVAHTTRVGRRTTLPHRLAVVAKDGAEAADLLAGRTTGPLWTEERDEHRRRVVFLFPGQGSQHAGMAHGLYRHEPVFRDHLDECAEVVGPELRSLLHSADAGPQLARTRFTQPALFAVEYSLAKLWQHWGVRPSAMVGHSVGEYVAACLSGVLSLPDALALVTTRGELMDGLPAGSMLGVPLSAADLLPLLDGELSLAASNAPTMSTVAGPNDAIDRLAARLADQGVSARRLHTSHAFHSAMVDPILPALADRVGQADLRAPRIPFAANTTGDWITAEQATDPAYWTAHARQAVRFSEGLRTVLADGPAVLLEVGPGNTLATLARQHDLAAGGHVVLGSLPHPREDRDDLSTALSALGRLWLAGADVDLTRPTADERRRRVPLPQYPFARDRHWIDLPGTAPVVEVAVADQVVEAVRIGGELAVVVGIWQELLGVPTVRPDEDFFELGGHSLLATRVLARISDALGVVLPAGAIFTAPTPARLTELAQSIRVAPVALEEDDELARVLAEIRQMSPEQLRAELDRERETEEIAQS
ncbi:MAG: beta-ketoacyl synthase N-terminal-like domain-containing protein [Umezawaea sp.]